MMDEEDFCYCHYDYEEEEHDSKVRQDAIDAFAEKLCAYVYDKDFMSDDVIRMIAEQLKEMESD